MRRLAKITLWVVAGLFGAAGQIIRIDADAVGADQAWMEFLEIPLGRGGGEHVAGVDAQSLEQRGQFIHKGDVEIALSILDDLRGFGDLD